MDLKKILILIVLIGFISVNAVSVSFGYGNGECDLFYIDCPDGFHNAGELDHDDFLFLSTSPTKNPYSTLHVYQNGTDSWSRMGCNYSFEEVGITIEKTFKDGNFTAFKADNSSITYAFYSDGQYDYRLELDHSGLTYDDAQFKEDADLLKEVAQSIKRK